MKTCQLNNGYPNIRTEAHQQAQEKLKADSTFRKRQFDCHKQVKPDEIQYQLVRVLTRSHPREDPRFRTSGTQGCQPT